MTTLHDFGGVLGHPLDTFFWALTISWSQLLALCEVALSVTYAICKGPKLDAYMSQSVASANC